MHPSKDDIIIIGSGSKRLEGFICVNYLIINDKSNEFYAIEHKFARTYIPDKKLCGYPEYSQNIMDRTYR